MTTPFRFASAPARSHPPGGENRGGGPPPGQAVPRGSPGRAAPWRTELDAGALPAARDVTQLEQLAQAERMLAGIATAKDAVDVIAFAEAARVWAQQARLGTSAVNHATVVKMRAERRLADAVDEGQKAGQIARREGSVRPPDSKTLDEIGVEKQRLAEARKIRDSYTDDDLIGLQRLADEADEVLSRKELVSRPRGRLISQAGGSEHWYTPLPHIEAARDVMGGIDLDPASSEIANRTVRASRFYTEHDDGLKQPWKGRVWLNPPYGMQAAQFVECLAEHITLGLVSAAVVLVSLHAMSTSWFDPLYDGTLCVTRGRLAFTDADGNPGSPTFGSVFAYFGPDPHRFASVFTGFGHILAAWD